jgi:hypothetical protein
MSSGLVLSSIAKHPEFANGFFSGLESRNLREFDHLANSRHSSAVVTEHSAQTFSAINATRARKVSGPVCRLSGHDRFVVRHVLAFEALSKMRAEFGNPRRVI